MLLAPDLEAMHGAWCDAGGLGELGHAERQRFGAGPCADATGRAAELQRAMVTASIAMVDIPRPL